MHLDNSGPIDRCSACNRVVDLGLHRCPVALINAYTAPMSETPELIEPTPRQLARAWFDVLDDLAVIATA